MFVCEMSMKLQIFIALQGVDIPAAHAVPLPFPESKVGAGCLMDGCRPCAFLDREDTSALLSINVVGTEIRFCCGGLDGPGGCLPKSQEKLESGEDTRTTVTWHECALLPASQPDTPDL